jgi:hypothetical protein
MILDKLMPYLYAALDIVSREMTGIIGAASRDSTADQIAKGQKVVVPVTNSRGTKDIVPGSPPAPAGTDFGKVEITIDHFKTADPIQWDGESEKAMGSKLNQMKVDQFAQGMRAVVNEIELDLAYEGVAGAIAAGNTYGTPGTTPFNGSLSDLAQIDKIMTDKGAPTTGRQMVLNTAAFASMISLTNLTNVNKAGNDETLRNGEITNLMGFGIHRSAGFRTISSGTGAGYLLNGAVAKGDTVIAIDTGTGAINQGALIKIGDDPNDYVVTEAAPSGGTSLTIAGGLKQDAADNAAITLSATPYLPSLALTRNSLVLASRLPYRPEQGDNALDVTTITDTSSGLSFQVAVYPDYMQNRVEIQAAWGVKSVIGRHSVVLLG